MIKVIMWTPVWLLMWTIQLVIKTPVMLLGFILQPIMYKHRNVLLKDMPWYLLWLTNPEDQPGGFPGYPDSFPSFWHNRMKAEGWSLRWAHYMYHAVRNPADGLRNYKWLQCPLRPEKIEWVASKYMDHYEPRFMEVGDFHWYVCWNGPYCGVKLNYVWSEDRYFEFKFGFRIHPRDTIAEAIDWKGTRAFLGASMASKFLPYRKY